MTLVVSAMGLVGVVLSGAQKEGTTPEALPATALLNAGLHLQLSIFFVLV